MCIFSIAYVEQLEVVKTQLEDDNDRLCLQLSESTNKLNSLKEMRSRESKGHQVSAEELSRKVCALEEVCHSTFTILSTDCISNLLCIKVLLNFM